MQSLYIDCLGIKIKVETDCNFVLENLSKDFALFSTKELEKSLCQISFSILSQNPPYDRVPPLESSLHGFGFICYKYHNVNYIVYSCDGLLIYDFAEEKGELFGKDEIFLYEKAKLTILSRLGELLDQRGLHRIHAFGVSKNNKSLICLLPMEGGKTTTIINLLHMDPQIKIIADDVCFIDRYNQIYPFLLRIGARDKNLLEHIPSQFITEIQRPYYGIKYFIDPAFLQDRLALPTHLTHILIGKRIFQKDTTIDKISKFKCLAPLFESGVFGMGLPQLMEFFVRGDFRLFSSRIRIIFSRIYFCFFLLGKTKTFVIKIGLDKQATCKSILEFLQ